jgi:hypothetical protein
VVSTMDPLITNGIDASLMRVLEKRGNERDAAPRRKRPAVPENPPEQQPEQEPDPDTPKHTLDDLA